MRRKFLKWVPLQTLGLTAVMVWLFLADKSRDLALLGETHTGATRALHAASSQLGHFDGGHITNNLVLFVIVGTAAELLLSRWVIPAMFVLCAVDSYLFDTDYARYLGFSGVAYALMTVSGVALGVRAVRRWRSHNTTFAEDVEMFIGGALGAFAVLASLVEIVVTASGGVEGINHGSHLRGALLGAMVAVVAFAVPTVRQEIRERRVAARRRAEWLAIRREASLGL